MNPKIDAYLKRAKAWREEMVELRRIVLGFELTEELKWGKPCYSFDGRNVVLIVPFKNYCTLMFGKGALLKDAHGILVKPGEHTQATRQIRLTSVRQIHDMEPILKAYIQEALDAEKAGLDVNFKAITEIVYVEELQRRLDESPRLKAAFEALTPGRRRGYNLYFSEAKQSKTRAARIEKCEQQILDGKGLHDEYVHSQKKVSKR
jgi:uncharacterized protein YdeI (YjbR/CyaY-like superfamily)